MTKLSDAARVLGRKGGLAGRGASQRRDPDHYRRISGRSIRWQRIGEWGSSKIRSGKAGWIVETWSCVMGDRFGRRVLIPYSDALPRGMDLSLAWNDLADGGDYLVDQAHDVGRPGHDMPGTRVLAKGRLVQ